MSKSVSVETNDVEHPQMSLVANFEVHASVEATPMYVQLYGPQGGDPLKAVVVLRRPDGKPLVIKEVLSTIPSVKSTIEPITEKNAGPPNVYPQAKPGDVRITFTSDASKEVARNAGNVKIVTNHPDKPELNIGLAVETVPMLRPVPAQIDVLRNRAEASGQGDASVMHQGGKAFRVTSVELRGDLPGCTARVVSDQAGGVQVVRVEASGPLPSPGIHRGAAIAKTDVAGTPEVEVPVILRIVPPPAAPIAQPGAGPQPMIQPPAVPQPNPGGQPPKLQPPH